jgi:hypothetical protein
MCEIPWRHSKLGTRRVVDLFETHAAYTSVTGMAESREAQAELAMFGDD